MMFVFEFWGVGAQSMCMESWHTYLRFKGLYTPRVAGLQCHSITRLKPLSEVCRFSESSVGFLASTLTSHPFTAQQRQVEPTGSRCAVIKDVGFGGGR